MEWYRGVEGDQRIWYEPQDIERIMSDELRKSGQRLTVENPAPDLERFVEAHLRVTLDQYADLPESVLGLTEFVVGRRPSMKINATLTEAAEALPANPGMRGRWRATIAHEASHVLLHQYLFDPAMAQVHRGDYRDPEPIAVESGGLMRCLHRDINDQRPSPTSRGSRDWREIQANRGMAALLMPAQSFRRASLRIASGLSLGVVTAGSPDAELLVGALAEEFWVSRQAAGFRLEGLGLLAAAVL
jgi:hypothetical protein